MVVQMGKGKDGQWGGGWVRIFQSFMHPSVHIFIHHIHRQFHSNTYTICPGQTGLVCRGRPDHNLRVPTLGDRVKQREGEMRMREESSRRSKI